MQRELAGVLVLSAALVTAFGSGPKVAKKNSPAPQALGTKPAAPLSLEFLVKPNPRAMGEALAIQETVAAILRRDKPLPRERLEHFRWIEEERRAKVMGWEATIEEASSTAAGTIVKLRIVPKHSAAGVQFADHAYETYYINNGRIRFLSLEPGHTPLGRRATCID